MAIAVCLLPAIAPAVISGDTCDTAVIVTDNGSYLFNTTGASANDPCFAGPPTVWYRFTAPRNGRVDADLCGSTFDTWLTVFMGASCPVSCASKLVENDNFCGFQSAVSFDAVEGTTYYFAVSSTTFTQFGPGVFNFEFTPVGGTCDVAQVITSSGSYEFDTTGANADNPCYPEGPPVVWYRFTAPRNGLVEADLCGSSFDTLLTVFFGASCPAACGFIIVENNDSCGLQSEVFFAATGGQTYNFAVSGPGAEDFGAGVFNFTFHSLGAGDSCVEAGSLLANGEYEFNSFGATEDDPCLEEVSTVWYRFVAPSHGSVSLDLCTGTVFDSRLTVFEGGSCPFACLNIVAENDNACGLQSALQFDAVQGQTYHIAVSGTEEYERGAGILTFEFTPTTIVIPGDINGDGVVNVADVTILANAIAFGKAPPPEVGDINGDGVVNALDVEALAQLIVQ